MGCLLSPGQPGPLLKDTHLTKPPKSQPKALPRPSNIFLSSPLPLRSPADLARHRKKSCLTPFTYIRQKKVFWSHAFSKISQIFLHVWVLHYQKASVHPICPPQPNQEFTVLMGHGEQNRAHVPCQTIVPGAQASLEVVILTLLVSRGTWAALSAHQRLLQMPCNSSTILPPRVLILTPFVVQIFGGHLVRKDGGGGESFFLLWGGVQLLFCLAFVLFQKEKKKSYLLAHMRFKPTASEQLRALLAFKPQEPDVLFLWFQPLSHFPGQHLHIGLPLLYWDSATHSQCCPLPEDPQMAWLPCTAMLPMMPTRRNLVRSIHQSIPSAEDILEHPSLWEGLGRANAGCWSSAEDWVNLSTHKNSVNRKCHLLRCQERTETFPASLYPSYYSHSNPLCWSVCAEWQLSISGCLQLQHPH